MAGWQDPENFAIGLFIAIMVVIVLVTGIVVITQILRGSDYPCRIGAVVWNTSEATM